MIDSHETTNHEISIRYCLSESGSLGKQGILLIERIVLQNWIFSLRVTYFKVFYNRANLMLVWFVPPLELFATPLNIACFYQVERKYACALNKPSWQWNEKQGLAKYSWFPHHDNDRRLSTDNKKTARRKGIFCLILFLLTLIIDIQSTEKVHRASWEIYAASLKLQNLFLGCAASFGCIYNNCVHKFWKIS